jgi:hypothetical protein
VRLSGFKQGNPPSETKTKSSDKMKTYSVKIQEAQDTSARYVSATASTPIEAIEKAVDWAQSYRCYGWDGEASTDGLTMRIRKVRAGQTELFAA